MTNSNEKETTFITLHENELTKHQAKEILRCLAYSLVDAVEDDKFNIVYNILYQDRKFKELSEAFYELYETDNIKTFINSMNVEEEV